MIDVVKGLVKIYKKHDAGVKYTKGEVMVTPLGSLVLIGNVSTNGERKNWCINGKVVTFESVARAVVERDSEEHMVHIDRWNDNDKMRYLCQKEREVKWQGRLIPIKEHVSKFSYEQ